MTFTTREKVWIAIILAVIFWTVFGCSCPKHDHWVDLPPTSTEGVTDQKFLESLYTVDNEGYFQNRLLHTTEIVTFDDPLIKKMAYTQCDDEVTYCTISFNLAYSLAGRTAAYTMLHEQCHIKTWGKEGNGHGKVWRSCMLQLDSQGAFRELLIDNYSEDM